MREDLAPSVSMVEGVSIYDTTRALGILPSSILESEGPGMWPARKTNVHKCHSSLLVSSCMGLEEDVYYIICKVCGCVWLCVESALAVRSLTYFCSGND